MIEERRIELLKNKLYLLGTEHVMLIKEGDYKKALQKSDEMDRISAKIQELTEKELEKTDQVACRAR